MKKINKNEITINKNDNYYIEINNYKDLIINVKSDCKIIIVSFCDYELNINVAKNTNVIINSLNNDSSINSNIELEDNSSITFNYSVINNNDSINNFTINHNGNNSNSLINNNGINISSKKLYFNINGIVNKKLNNINCSQVSKIINYHDGDSKIIPNLIIDSNDISANHSAYIGNLDNDLKFYLASRGLDDKDINRLLFKSIMLGNMLLTEEEELFNKLVNEWSEKDE